MSHEDTTDRDSMQDFNLGLGLGGGVVLADWLPCVLPANGPGELVWGL